MEKMNFFKIITKKNILINQKNIIKSIYELKIKKRKNMFNLKPNSKFLEKIVKSTCKSDFMNKIKRKIKNENSPIVKLNNSNNIIFKRKKGELPSLSARSLKSTKFNNDCNLIYEKIKKTLI